LSIAVQMHAAANFTLLPENRTATMKDSRALLLIDLQNDYYPGGAYELARIGEASEKAAELLDRFRSAGKPLIHIRHEFASADAPFFRPGSEGTAIHESVAPLPGETVIMKQYVNSFRETDLDSQLRALGVKELVIAGAMSHMCIQGGTRAAADLGYQVEVIHDACATRDQEFDGRQVTAADVHAASMAALGFAYAKVLALKDWK
jgi:nicotinamidase-related amidase